jgi:peptidoglycan/LPS O-acetylase OafA/YrhL
MRAFFMLSDVVTGLLLLVGSIAAPLIQEHPTPESLSSLPPVLLGLAFLALVPSNIRPSRRHVWIRTLTYAVGFVYLAAILGADFYSGASDIESRQWQFFIPWMLLLFVNVVAYPLCVHPKLNRLQNQ